MMTRVNFDSIGGGEGNDTEIFVLSEHLALNSYVDFTVKSSTYQAIGIIGLRNDSGLTFTYFRTDPFTNGLFARTNTSTVSKADSFMFTFPDSHTLRVTNSEVGQTANGIKAGATIILVH